MQLISDGNIAGRQSALKLLTNGNLSLSLSCKRLKRLGLILVSLSLTLQDLQSVVVNQRCHECMHRIIAVLACLYTNCYGFSTVEKEEDFASSSRGRLNQGGD